MPRGFVTFQIASYVAWVNSSFSSVVGRNCTDQLYLSIAEEPDDSVMHHLREGSFILTAMRSHYI